MKRLFLVLIFLLATLCIPAQKVTTGIELKSIPSEINYAGNYGGHLQGFTSDYRGAIFWSHTTQLVKTDFSGKVLKVIDVPFHHGDPEYYKGRVYVAVNLGRFNEEPGLADSWIYIYDARDLQFMTKYPVPEVVYGAGGIAIHDGKVIIVGGLPGSGKYTRNPVYEYNLRFELQKVHWLESGYTYKGIQIATYYNGSWYFGCYGNSKSDIKAVVLKTKMVDANLQLVKTFDLDYSFGMIGLDRNKWLVSSKSFGKKAKMVEFVE